MRILPMLGTKMLRIIVMMQLAHPLVYSLMHVPLHLKISTILPRAMYTTAHTVDPQRPIVTNIMLGIIETPTTGTLLRAMDTPTVVALATIITTAGMSALVEDIRMIVAILDD